MTQNEKDKALIEDLASKFHEIYQIEAKRQGDIRHKDNYDDLPENIKEFDRALARYVAAQTRLTEQRVREELITGMSFQDPDCPSCDSNASHLAKILSNNPEQNDLP